MAQALAEPQERLVEVETTEPEHSAPAPAAEEKTFRPYDPDQVLLMAPVLQDAAAFNLSLLADYPPEALTILKRLLRDMLTRYPRA